MKSRAVLLSGFLFVVAALPIAVSANERSPEDTVRQYLSAMQSHRFNDAYDHVSKALRAGKDREEWAKEQKTIVDLGEVKIFEFKVFPARDVTADKARVPNILKSQDKYLNQLGLDEYEIYDLVKEDGQWRIDQQTLVEGDDKNTFFPQQ